MNNVYESMTSEQLEGILADDVESAALDGETLLEILDLIERRRGERGCDVEDMWRRFERDYLGAERGADAPALTAKTGTVTLRGKRNDGRKERTDGWKRVALTAVAAVLLLVLTSTILFAVKPEAWQALSGAFGGKQDGPQSSDKPMPEEQLPNADSFDFSAGEWFGRPFAEALTAMGLTEADVTKVDTHYYELSGLKAYELSGSVRMFDERLTRRLLVDTKGRLCGVSYRYEGTPDDKYYTVLESMGLAAVKQLGKEHMEQIIRNHAENMRKEAPCGGSNGWELSTAVPAEFDNAELSDGNVYVMFAEWAANIRTTTASAEVRCRVREYARYELQIPTPEEAVEMGEQELCTRLEGKTRDEIIAAWGKPDGMLSGMFGDLWKWNGDNRIIVYYEWADATVSDVRKPDEIPPLEEAVGMSNDALTARLKDKLRDELIAAWGEPNYMATVYSDVWTCESGSVEVYYARRTEEQAGDMKLKLVVGIALNGNITDWKERRTEAISQVSNAVTFGGRHMPISSADITNEDDSMTSCVWDYAMPEYFYVDYYEDFVPKFAFEPISFEFVGNKVEGMNCYDFTVNAEFEIYGIKVRAEYYAPVEVKYDPNDD